MFADLGNMDNDVKAAFDAGNNFQQKLNDTLLGLISANNDRKSEIDALRGDHEELKKNHEAFVVTAERENDLRKNEIKSLEERTQKDNQVGPIHLKDELSFWGEMFRPQDKFSGQIFALMTKYFGLKWHFVFLDE